jgi:hypothetical protein
MASLPGGHQRSSLNRSEVNIMQTNINPWIEQPIIQKKENDGAVYESPRYGWKFKLRRKGPMSRRWQSAVAKMQTSMVFKELAKRQAVPGYVASDADRDTDQKLVATLFVDGCLAGWSDVVDSKGKKMALSRDNAIKVFSTFPELLADCDAFASDPANYRATDEDFGGAPPEGDEGEDEAEQEGNSEDTSDTDSEGDGKRSH